MMTRHAPPERSVRAMIACDTVRRHTSGDFHDGASSMPARISTLAVLIASAVPVGRTHAAPADRAITLARWVGAGPTPVVWVRPRMGSDSCRARLSRIPHGAAPMDEGAAPAPIAAQPAGPRGAILLFREAPGGSPSAGGLRVSPHREELTPLLLSRDLAVLSSDSSAACDVPLFFVRELSLPVRLRRLRGAGAVSVISGAVADSAWQMRLRVAAATAMVSGARTLVAIISDSIVGREFDSRSATLSSWRLPLPVFMVSSATSQARALLAQLHVPGSVKDRLDLEQHRPVRELGDRLRVSWLVASAAQEVR